MVLSEFIVSLTFTFSQKELQLLNWLVSVINLVAFGGWGAVLYRWKSWGSKLICSFSLKKIQGREDLILQAAFRWSLTVMWSLELWAVCWAFFTDQFTVPCQESPLIFFYKAHIFIREVALYNRPLFLWKLNQRKGIIFHVLKIPPYKGLCNICIIHWLPKSISSLVKKTLERHT